MTDAVLSAKEKKKASWIKKASILSEALPYMRRYSGKTIVIKYGGHAMGDEDLALSFAHDVVLMKQVGMNPIVVHGGGPQIGRMLDRLKIESSFIDGLRVTDKATVEVVEMVLSGSINKSIVGAINRVGGHAIGLSGKDNNLVVAEPLRRTKKDPDSQIEQILDLGFVGYPKEVNGDFLKMFQNTNIIPVIAPIGLGETGETYNINADTMAGAIAGSLVAERLLLLTDVAGVLDKDKILLPDLTEEKTHALIADGTILGGMIPKVDTCLHAVEKGVKGSVIIDGRVEHALLLELFTEHGVGTLIHK
ncbi:acetylglutamate kinase [Paremcibacter congregatus]|uniref:Acetylglutamate kinase n=1 Tax=Paremcibacter congregatus TaxID=2043170 RepID=A0A2G4YWB3_9PROT|nr:acetylglutamate kinase [Paremcibacter congregatus]PHZ86631.1 acetylglutamate kinase [Paremcibacter congregatus]QDE26433.1 acetylglutamate kinase [Paremcibacter congregatus]